MSTLIWVHGWAMNAQVWQPMLDQFSTHRHVCLELPGHGIQPNVDGGLDAWGHALSACQDSGVWIGWSLGGLMTLWIAQHYPERVKKLVMIAATPKFTAESDWPSGVQKSIFEDFSIALESDTLGSLKRFMALQMLGVAHAKPVVQQLQQQVDLRPPDVNALITGLELLKTADLRPALSALQCPLQIVLGENDPLVSTASAQAIRELCPKVHVTVIAGAAHVPFLSHPQRVYEKMAQFISAIV